MSALNTSDNDSYAITTLRDIIELRTQSDEKVRVSNYSQGWIKIMIIATKLVKSWVTSETHNRYLTDKYILQAMKVLCAIFDGSIKVE